MSYAPATSLPAATGGQPSDVPGAQRADLARGSALSLVGSSISAVMGLLLVVLLGNVLGDIGAGVILQVIAVFSIALGVARCGMDSAALWLLPRLRDDDPQALRPAALTTIGIAGLVGVGCATAVAGGAWLLAAADPDTALAPALASAAWGLPVAAMLLTALAASRALGGLGAYVGIGSIALPVLRVLLVAAAGVAGLSLVGITLAWTVPLLLALVATTLVLNKQLRRAAATDQSGTVSLGAGRTRSILGFGLPRMLSQVLEQLLLWLDVVLVGIIAGPAAAGIYGAASRFVLAGMVVDTAVRAVVSPWFSRLAHRGDGPALAELFRTATTWLVLFGTPVYLLLAIYAPLPLSLVGPEFRTGAGVVVVLCLGAIVTFLAGNIHSVLLMSGRSGLAAQNKTIAVATNVVLLVLLVPHWGVTGAALAWSAAMLLDAAMATVQVRVLLKLPLDLRAGLYPLAVAAATVGIPALLIRLVLGPTWPALALATAIGGIAFLAWTRHRATRLQLDAFAALLHRSSKDA